MAINNPIRGRINAAFFSLLDGFIDRLMRDRKRRLFAGLPRSVVELGPGTGANFRYFAPHTRVIAIEPNVHMHRKLQAEADRRGLEVEVVAASAESTGLPDASVDAVVSTLVLCTVPDVAATLAEVRRILKPGGRLLFLEHVAAPAGSWLRVLQRLVKWPWHYFFEGCHTDRHTLHHIEEAGFRRVDAEQAIVKSPFVPVNAQVWGSAEA